MTAEKREGLMNPMTNTKAINSNTLYRLYNAAVGVLVLVQYMNDAEAAASEYIPDMFIHLFEAVAPNSCKDLAIATNHLRAVQSLYGLFSGKSSISLVANAIDVVNHELNVAYRMSER